MQYRSLFGYAFPSVLYYQHICIYVWYVPFVVSNEMWTEFFMKFVSANSAFSPWRLPRNVFSIKFKLPGLEIRNNVVVGSCWAELVNITNTTSYGVFWEALYQEMWVELQAFYLRLQLQFCQICYVWWSQGHYEVIFHSMNGKAFYYPSLSK